jgi:D-serine deaminase-like pyridoxal phosphate-dependent protein
VGLAPISVNVAGSAIALTIQAEAGKSYSVLSSEAIQPAQWTKFTDVPASSTNGPVRVPLSVITTGSARFYRLVAPAQPELKASEAGHLVASDAVRTEVPVRVEA